MDSLDFGVGPSAKCPYRIFSLMILFTVFLQYGEFFAVFVRAFWSDKPSPKKNWIVNKQLLNMQTMLSYFDISHNSGGPTPFLPFSRGYHVDEVWTTSDEAQFASNWGCGCFYFAASRLLFFRPFWFYWLHCRNPFYRHDACRGLCWYQIFCHMIRTAYLERR